MAKVDIDDHTDLAIEYGVNYISLLLFCQVSVDKYLYVACFKGAVCGVQIKSQELQIVVKTIVFQICNQPKTKICSVYSCLIASVSPFLQVSAVPTVIAMRGGDVVDQFVGIKDDDELDSFVSKVIGQ